MPKHYPYPPRRLERQIRRSVSTRNPAAFYDCHQFLLNWCGYDSEEAYEYCERLTGAYRMELLDLNYRSRKGAKV